MFRTVFVEAKKNIPFDSHSSLVQLQEINGLHMGYHHFERCGATMITESISAHMHTLLIDNMVSKNLPFSIIIDGSTDSTESHFLIVYFQILDNNTPVVCFYGLIETTSDRTASGLFNSIVATMSAEKRDFLNYFKRNLVGYASDGERVMSGSSGGLISFIRKHTRHPIYAIHCMAHRIHLAISKSFNAIPYFQKFENFINKLFQFYNWNASKRKSHLKETALNLNMKIYELNYIYKERWISSELQSIRNLRKMWLLLSKDLQLISTDENFDVKSKAKAHKLQLELTGKNFLAIINFLYDILEHLSFWSLKMQERTALLVDFVDFREKIVSTFEKLKEKNGRELTILLEHATCDGNICESLDTYYSSDIVTFLNEPLGSETNVPKIDEIRQQFLTSMIDEIKSYFPTSDLNLFKIFKPVDIPSDISEALTYGVAEIIRLCDIFRMGECTQLVKDWGNLLISIIESENFCSYRTPKTETYAFWSHFLNEPGIVWTSLTTELIQTILVIPIGSADAERGFSIMNHIQTTRRSRLTRKHIEDLMRIRINSVDDLKEFAASKYARQFLTENHYRTDDPKGIRSKKSSLLSESEEKKKYLPKASFL